MPPDHSLRRVKPCLDCERFRDLLTDCSSATLGRTAEEPVRRLKRAFLPFPYRLSEREVGAAAQVNGAFRLLLALALARRWPVPSLLAQLRTRGGVARQQVRFDPIVTQARAQGLGRDRRRRKDATPSLAHLAVPSTWPLVAQTRPRLGAAARPYAPERGAAEAAEAEQLRPATAALKAGDRVAHRGAHLRASVAWADPLEQALGPRPAQPEQGRAPFAAALALAQRVRAERDEPDQGDPGRRVGAPDARCGKQGADFAGSLLAVRVDAESALLTALNLLPGQGDEARDAQTRLEAEARAQGTAVAALSIDGSGGNGEGWRTLSAPAGLAVEVYGPPPAPAELPFFPPAAVVLDAERGGVTCPGGHQGTTKARKANHPGWQCVFARRPWAGGLLQARCLATRPQTKGRSVLKNEYQAEYDAARERATTARYAAVRQHHPRVERKLADIVRYHDGRRSRYRGQGRVKGQ